MEIKSNNPNIIYLEYDNIKYVEAVSKLHMTLLPESILSELGCHFLSRYYYKHLVRLKLIDVYLYLCDGTPVGFISSTNLPFSFMKKGFVQAFPSLMLTLVIAIIRKPNRIMILIRFILNMKSDSLMEKLKKKYEPKLGEFLSFGVLSSYRKQIDVSLNITIPNVLMKMVLTHLYGNNMQFSLLRILASNKRAIKFYHKHGAVVIPSERTSQVVVIIENTKLLIA